MRGRVVVGSGMRAMAVLGLLLTAATAHAQGTITSGDASYVINLSHFDTSPSANLIVMGTEDHLFESGWWFRVAGDPAETAFPAPDNQTYVGDTATLTWSDAGGRGFSAQEVAVISDGGANMGQVLLSLTLTNLNGMDPLGIDVFHMADVDLQPTAGNDAGALLTANTLMQVTHASNANTLDYMGVDASALLVRAFGATDVAAELSNASLSTFDNSGLPFGPGDFTAGHQWTGTVIPPLGSATFVAVLAANMSATPPTTTSSTSTSSTSTSSTSSTTLLATTTSSTSSTSTSSTTTTLPPPDEVCGNCLDDDGDGLIDFEDANCCVPSGAQLLNLKKGKFKTLKGGGVLLNLGAALSQTGIVGDTPTQSVTLQIRRAGQGEVLCATIPASKLARKRTTTSFRDRTRSLASAKGIERLRIAERKKGGGTLKVKGTLGIALPGPGPFTVTMGLRDPATAEAGNRCATGTKNFVARGTGIVLE